MRASGLRKGAIRFHLHGVNEIGKFDGVLNEEYRNVVADQVPVSLFRIEFYCETAHVARRID